MTSILPFNTRRWAVLAVALLMTLGACQRGLTPTAQLTRPTNLPVNTQIAPDPTAEKTIAPYQTRVNQTMNEVIGQAPVALEKGVYESALGNFVSDLSRTQTMAVYGKPIDLGGMTNGGLRNPIDQGPITVGDVFELMPFENEMLVLTLSGQTVKEMFDFAARTRILVLANASYTVRNGQVESIFIGGKPFDQNKTYTLAISDYLANGGDNMSFLKDALKREQTGLLARDAIMKEIKQRTAQGKPVVAEKDGRVKVLN
ncbi:5'-nucleotidase C-terminal domain-containing protein [Rufibacter quisquiliarum]|uniref:2',3'-cyclic-nucleotide 2'-phosphodiesterase (5'-nucleotidase family) n=1 Tax=Rufibacter quisquiliarum TaxID=1549639 RepID=A0A839GKS4_9BACT|nr:5'-nucleotidase C-terminal domain-containing protein [Rufibacter quisquiliarum]MBA9075557.1 2',3'-cyclic-nucleotide 2'-phosphodiesterase (5'-nucleotidase family) [Rufibacter quisquiliarum]